jgi:hypothetical protein
LKTPQTSQQWWDEVSQDEAKLVDWLKRQFHCEGLAAQRISRLIDLIPFDNKREWRMRILSGIVIDEANHAKWIGDVLAARGISTGEFNTEERYWNQVLPSVADSSFEYMCAVGHLAEDMRLLLLKAIKKDTREQFADVATVMGDIYYDEVCHTELFKLLSTPEAIEEARKFHNDGMNALGLVA